VLLHVLLLLQVAVASTLGLPMNKLVCKTKRLGGGFGGKETRGVFIHCAVAVPAYHTRRPVKAVLDRDEDMQMTGLLGDTCSIQLEKCPA